MKPVPLALLFFACIVAAVHAGGTTEPSDPADEDRRTDRDTMVTEQIAGRGVSDPKVLAAMRSVPRHLFVPENERRNAYADRPLPIGHGQTISQPYIVAFMTELLELTGDEKVLEIGTGSGYQAAVLAEITPHVYSIEIIEPLLETGTAALETAGYTTVKTKAGDGYHGWEDYAPFDRIIVTAAAGHIPPPLVEQLAPDGIIVIPVGSPYQVQTLIRAVRDPERGLTTESIATVRFVPMTGRAHDGE
ncbi:MAG: protein-L-isoaspartate(D-aspartate) O-methyltransferase [Spirochaetaceae bacterium]|nr:MAG: protein-L-isoaspartate(D-aspartate) O-methyltransferase [Spirochaetaceae bacterium]